MPMDCDGKPNIVKTIAYLTMVEVDVFLNLVMVFIHQLFITKLINRAIIEI